MSAWRTSVFLVALATTAHAEPRIELGGFGGLTSSKTRTYSCAGPLSEPCSDTYSEPHYSEPGIAIGASVRYIVHRGVLFVVDVAYTQKGIYGGPNGTHNTYHYVEAPVLAQLDAGRASSSSARLFVYAGLAPAVRVACTANGTTFDNEAHMAIHYSGSCEGLPYLEVPNVFDLGFVVGAGGGYSFPFATVDLQVRATHGLTDIEGDGGGKTINRVFSIVVAVSRPI